MTDQSEITQLAELRLLHCPSTTDKLLHGRKASELLRGGWKAGMGSQRSGQSWPHRSGRFVSFLTHAALGQMLYTFIPSSPLKEPCQARSPGLFYC